MKYDNVKNRSQIEPNRSKKTNELYWFCIVCKYVQNCVDQNLLGIIIFIIAYKLNVQ